MSLGRDDKYIEVDGKRIMMWNDYYKCYTAEYCRTTGKLMLNKNSYEPYADKYLSTTRCKAIKKPVQEGEEPIAFYRVMNGYKPLYDRSEE